MSLGSSLSATLGLNISKFRKGLADASASATTWRKGLQKNLGEMGGGNLAGLLGVAGLMQGFSAATREAQRLRDAAKETGAPLSANVEAAARLADNLDKAKAGAAGIAAVMLGGMQRAIDEMALRWYALFTSDTVEGLKAFEKEKAAQDAKNGVAEAKKKKAIEATNKARAAGADEKTKLAAVDEKLAAARKARAIEGESREMKIKRIINEGNAAYFDSIDNAKTLVQRKEAQVRVEELLLELARAKKELTDEADKNADNEKDAATKKREALKEELRAMREQLKTLRDQSKEIEKGVAAARRASLLPSLADVASGERDIGKGAKQSATALGAARSEEQRLADQAQRLFEDEKASTNPFTKARIGKDRDAVNAARNAARSRINTLEGSLSGRVTGIGNETERAQLTELEAIRTASQQTAWALIKTEVKK